MASHFTFGKVPLRLLLVKRRGEDATIHLAGFNNLPLCLISRGKVTKDEVHHFERIDGTLTCQDCKEWARKFEENWIKGGQAKPRKPSSPNG